MSQLQSPGVSPSGSPAERPSQEPPNPGGGSPTPKPAGEGDPPCRQAPRGPPRRLRQKGKFTPPGWIGLVPPLRTLTRRPPTPVPHGTGRCPLPGPQTPLSSARTKANDDNDDDDHGDAERHVPAPRYAFMRTRRLISPVRPVLLPTRLGAEGAEAQRCTALKCVAWGSGGCCDRRPHAGQRERRRRVLSPFRGL